MKIRHDSVFISSVLFTIALLSLVPWCWQEALAGRDDAAFRAPEPGVRRELQTMGQLGMLSLTIISIGLIVTWMGYVRGIRWTWLVMFSLVWGWAYPILAIRVLIFNLSMRWIIDLFHAAIYDPNPSTPRALLETMLIFGLMLIALVLPLRAFLKSGSPDLVRAH